MGYPQAFIDAIGQAAPRGFGVVLSPGRVCPLTLIHPLTVKAGKLMEQTPLDAPEILTTALQAYDRYVAPVEVPGFGRMFEPEADSKLRDVLSILLESLADRLVP